MKIPVLAFWLFVSGVALAAGDTPSPTPLASVLKGNQVTTSVCYTAESQLTFKLHNSSAKPVTIEVPAGTIAANADSLARFIVLRAGITNLPAGESAELSLPAAALSITQPAAALLSITPENEPKLQGLLQWLATQPDVPKSTAQLAVFCFRENIDFAAWEKFLIAAHPDTAASIPSPADVTQAIDVLGLLRKLAPEQTFALASDNGLKLRALRNPWCRTKAAQIYGLDGGDGGVAPDLGQLLHTKPGDNCPICRQRALLQQPANDL